jgi:transposase
MRMARNSLTRGSLPGKGLDGFPDQFEDAESVLESSGIWEFIYEAIEARGFPVNQAHPLRVRAIAEAKVKTDKVDAKTLAQLLRADMMPPESAECVGYATF